MIRPAAMLIAVLACTAAAPQGERITVTATDDGAAQITRPGGRKTVVAKEFGQVDISEAQVVEDGTVGWFVEYKVEGVGYPISGRLVIWRDGKIIQRFDTEQVFYSWVFVKGSEQVAYHDGPLHGETASHCELHDVATGRVIDKWDGDLEGTGKPVWTTGLNH